MTARQLDTSSTWLRHEAEELRIAVTNGSEELAPLADLLDRLAAEKEGVAEKLRARLLAALEADQDVCSVLLTQVGLLEKQLATEKEEQATTSHQLSSDERAAAEAMRYWVGKFQATMSITSEGWSNIEGVLKAWDRAVASSKAAPVEPPVTHAGREVHPLAWKYLQNSAEVWERGEIADRHTAVWNEWRKAGCPRYAEGPPVEAAPSTTGSPSSSTQSAQQLYTGERHGRFDTGPAPTGEEARTVEAEWWVVVDSDGRSEARHNDRRSAQLSAAESHKPAHAVRVVCQLPLPAEPKTVPGVATVEKA